MKSSCRFERRRTEAEAFVARGGWLEDDDRPQLRSRTRENYLGGIRRAASILVDLGMPPDALTGLAALTEVEQVRSVLKAIYQSTGRKRGGHVGFMAVLLYMIARDHVGMTGTDLERLAKFTKDVKQQPAMSDRTLQRYLQFDDADLLDALLRLPDRLMSLADARPEIDAVAARLAAPPCSSVS